VKQYVADFVLTGDSTTLQLKVNLLPANRAHFLLARIPGERHNGRKFGQIRKVIPGQTSGWRMQVRRVASK
jgi:hypothetical protein